MKRTLLTLFVIVVLASSLASCAPPFDAYGQVLTDVTYCTMDGGAQLLDLYFPAEGGPWPVLVYIHGGGWTEGDKSEAAGWAADLTARGYAVASVNYRLYPAARFPAMIEDVKCAVRFLRAHASQYNLDPDRFGAMGASAGGHLVALLGTSDEDAGFDLGEYPRQSSRVQAVVDLCGFADLTSEYPNSGIETLILINFGRDQMVAGSPVTYVTADDPPFLIFHGNRDEIIPVEQASLLYDSLTAAGVPVNLVIVQNGNHGLAATGGPATPTLDEICQMELDFLEMYLKQGGN